MAIIFHERSREFHLFNKNISYIFKIIDNNQLGQLYYGKKVMDRDSFEQLFEKSRRDMAPYTFEGDTTFSLEHIKQEYPTFGTGDMRRPAYVIERENGSRIINPIYKSHKIFPGKTKLENLPATYVEKEEEATTLEIVLEDAEVGLQIFLVYTIFENYPVITKNVRFTYLGEAYIDLLTALSGCMDLPDNSYELVKLVGAWSREREIEKESLNHGIYEVYSMRGCSSHQFNPFMALKRKNADENNGEVLGFSLIYSGSFLGSVEVDNYNVTRVIMGIHPNNFTWRLSKGEVFQTPELVMVYSDKGLNEMSQVYHELYRTRLARGIWKEKERPILINSWEAFYFNYNEKELLKLAKKSKDVGIELFVLDDGWFGKRNDATSSLGDWDVNKEKFPKGLREFSRKLKDIGMNFGLWIEPEMFNKESNLYKKHPEWILGEVGKNLSHSRYQYVLDFSKEEVVDYIYEMIAKVMEDSEVNYIKWDMNRSFSEMFSNGKGRCDQGKVEHKYIVGVYDLYERLITRFPNVLFESCASGGARFDPGMLYYAPQGWISDNTDAISRLKIQYGTSLVYPLSSMGSHVSASPNHQSHRKVPLTTRGNVAYFGTFGYELDLNELTEKELSVVREQIHFMKKYRELIQKGSFYRLCSPFEGNVTAWMVVSKDKKRALVGYYRISQPVNVGFERIKLKGLMSDHEYQVKGYSYTSYGDELMEIGIITSDESSGVVGKLSEIQGDYLSRIFEIEMIN